MKTITLYGSRSFGNTENARNYVVRLRRFGDLKGDIHVEFAFDEAVDGRGGGYSCGYVRSVAFQLPIGVCTTLMSEMSKVGSQIDVKRSEFHVHES